MKLSIACTHLSIVFILSVIVFKQYVLLKKVSNVNKKYTGDNVMINPQEFVFFNVVERINFERKKNERTRYLLERLCNVKRTKNTQHTLVTRIPLHAIATRINVLAKNKQQFGVPQIVGKNMLIKKIATEQLSEKNIFSKKYSEISALQKLLE